MNIVQQDVPVAVNNEGLPPARPIFTELSLDALWELRGEADYQLRDLRDYKGSIDQELTRRFGAAHPDFNEDTGGTVAVAGESVVLKMGYSRSYAYNQEPLLLLQGELTDDEYGKLVAWEPKVSGTVFNSLLRRGGKVAELLQRARFLKSASPSFEAKERV